MNLPSTQQTNEQSPIIRPMNVGIAIPFLIGQLVESVAATYNVYAESVNTQRETTVNNLDKLSCHTKNKKFFLKTASYYDNGEIVVFDERFGPSPETLALRFRYENNCLRFIGEHPFRALKGDEPTTALGSADILKGYVYGGVQVTKICRSSDKPWLPYFWASRSIMKRLSKAADIVMTHDELVNFYEFLPLLDKAAHQAKADADYKTLFFNVSKSPLSEKTFDPMIGAVNAIGRAIREYLCTQDHDQRATALMVLIRTINVCTPYFHDVLTERSLAKDFLYPKTKPFYDIIGLESIGQETLNHQKIRYVHPQLIKSDGSLAKGAPIIRFF